MPIVFAWKTHERGVLEPGQVPFITLRCLEHVELWTGQMARVRTGLAIATEDDYTPIYFPPRGLPGLVCTGSECINSETILSVVNLSMTFIHLEPGSEIARMQLLPTQMIEVIPRKDQVP